MTTCSEENNKFTFHWKIKHFSYIVEPNIRTSKFMIDYQEACEWQLHLKEEEGNCKLFLYRVDELSKQATYHYNFKIVSSDGQDIISQNMKKMFINESWEKHEAWIFPLSSQDILENKGKYLPNDCLTVQITMWRDSPKELDVSRICAVSNFSYPFKFSFIWNAKNFCKGFKEERIFSLNSLTFKLNLLCSDKTVSLFIYQLESLDWEICVKFKLCISKCNQPQKEIIKKILIFSEGQKSFEFPSLLENSESEIGEFLLLDVLSLYFEFQEEGPCGTKMEYKFENPLGLKIQERM